ncbi:hypothetical protein [uncultured Sphingomonas sp.]|uniref:hypothetical protein n=1 Tax=uncultured Sphingomonas sp. TaxID=158754 RepID=UPI0035CAD91B
MPNAARTAAACRIARLDRQKFNDLMASGDYDCAPRTSPGVPRVFERPDLIGLFLFARLTERGRTARQASDVTCRVVGILANAVIGGRDLPEHVAVAYGVNGGSFAAEASDVNPLGNVYLAGGASNPILLTEVWNIANLGAEVDRGLAEEARVVGDD